MTYSVAIRTLGTAGEKYLKELQSVDKQTIQPEHIFVYIPHGYDLPKETIGKEEYIRCDKGMITQRSLPFDEITSDYILFLDDDIYLPEDCVEKLFAGIEEYGADAISADAYSNHQESWGQKLKFIAGGTYPHFKQDLAFHIRRCGHYSYNNNPRKTVLPSESASFALCLIKKEVYKAIHFEDERWMEGFRYCQGDDQLFYYKLFLYGYKLLVHYDTGMIHLDAGAGHINNPEERNRVYSVLRYIMWYRTMIDIKQSVKNRCYNSLCFYASLISKTPLSIFYALTQRRFYFISNIARGVIDGRRFLRTDAYKLMPKFDAYKREI